jgi:cation:H+ antiporter
VNPQNLLFLALGLAVLAGGAEILVRGAARMAAALGISSLVIGLTIVSLGTSAPELAVSLGASLTDRTNIAIGNVIGSNIFNVLFVLGLCAMIAPLVVARQLVRLDVPVMIGVSLLLMVMALDGAITRLDGLWLVIGLAAYVVFAIVEGKREGADADQAPELPERRVPDILLVLAGLGLLLLGARWLVDSATVLALELGVSDLVIGLTVVAVGTSLPEVATSVVATLRGQRDIAVGNIVGSNIFNILGILGVTTLVAGSLPVPASVIRFDLPVMVAVALACMPIFATGHSIARWEGGLFFGYFLAYTSYLVLESMQHQAAQTFGSAMLAFVLPLTTITLVVVVARAARAQATN